MKFLLFLGLAVLISGEANCNNPLFSTANWPTDLSRPRYLTTPMTITNSTGFCAKFQSGATSTCCNKDTVQDIVAMFVSRREKMKTKGEGLEGGVKDTFNDFDPDNQRAKGTNAGAGAGAGKNATSTTGKGKPAAANNPSGFDNVDVPDSELGTATPPKGRGKEKQRPGLLKLSTAGQESIATIVRNMNALMKQFAHTMGKCMNAQLKHLAGMMCMGCDPNWESWVTGTATTTITVDLSSDACTELSDACLDFVTQAQNLPTLVEEMRAQIKAVIDSEIAAGTISASDLPTDDLSGTTKAPAAVTPVCSSDSTCKTYICEVMSKGKAGISPEPSTVADPAGVSTATTSGRELTATVTYSYSSSGYNSVSIGDASASSSATTSTTGALIDGVSTDTAPLTTSSSASVYLAISAVAALLLH